MSEPTPLSAEAESFVRKYKADGNAAMLQATSLIDAQATEIAALKGALESIEDAWAKLVEPGWQKHIASLKGADAPEASHAWVKHIFTFQLAGFRARVLAGKETRDE